MTLLLSSVVSFFAPAQEETQTVYRGADYEVVSSNRPIAPHALRVRHITSQENHPEEFALLQKIGRIWQQKGIASDYVIYHCSEKPQDIEMIPFRKTANRVAGFCQQLRVFGNICFEWLRPTISAEKRAKEIKEYALWETEFKKPLVEAVVVRTAGDRLSQSQTIARQYVLKEERVQILYDRYPVGFGGSEKLHFLITVRDRFPQDFSEMSQEEYVAARQLIEAADQLGKRRKLEQIYWFTKKGRPAGQSIMDVHFHLIATTTKMNDLLGKLVFLTRMVLGPQHISDTEYDLSVAKYRGEFKGS